MGDHDDHKWDDFVAMTDKWFGDPFRKQLIEAAYNGETEIFSTYLRPNTETEDPTNIFAVNNVKSFKDKPN